MKKAIMSTIITLIIVIFLGRLSGYIIIPWQKIEISGKPTQKVIYRESGSTESHLLTDNPNEIQTLLSSLERTWVSTLRGAPKNEKVYSIEFVNDSTEWAFNYYPESDTIMFFSGMDYPNPLLSLHSNKELTNLIARAETISNMGTQ